MYVVYFNECSNVKLTPLLLKKSSLRLYVHYKAYAFRYIINWLYKLEITLCPRPRYTLCPRQPLQANLAAMVAAMDLESIS